MHFQTYLSVIFAAIAVFLTAYHCSTKPPLEKNKLILSWVPFFGNSYYYFGDGQPETFKAAGCKYTNCEITVDRRRLRIDEYDALLFHGFEDYEILFGTPNYRKPKQIYVYINFESAKRSYIPKRRSNFFNTTITYRLDSDYPWTYFNILDKETGAEVAPSLDPVWENPDYLSTDTLLADDIKQLLKKKKHAAAWFVSNCHSVSGREEYVQKLLGFGIEVHIYGACGTLSCPLAENAKCTHFVEEYYFYLAFENSLCDDYVTEKTVTALKGGAVPIILSGANLTRFLPPNSYLDAQKLGPERLSVEMKKLMNDHDEYAKMFWWRTKYSVVRRGPYDWPINKHPFCALCEAANKGTISVRRRNITIRDWWHTATGGVNKACL